MKSLPQLKKDCQKLFNEYIRKRDLTGDYFKCISCGQIKDERFMHAGHYYNVGFYEGLRFDEDNCHGQCNHCNTFLHGNLIEYRDNLLFKIGAERFEKLKIRAGNYKRTGYKFSRFELIKMINELKIKIQFLK
jgi:hypothetical protein